MKRFHEKICEFLHGLTNHSTLWKLRKFTLTEKKFRQITYVFSNFFSKTVTFTKFLPKMREREFP